MDQGTFRYILMIKKSAQGGGPRFVILLQFAALFRCLLSRINKEKRRSEWLINGFKKLCHYSRKYNMESSIGLLCKP